MLTNKKDLDIFRTRQIYKVLILLASIIVGCNELLPPEPERLGYAFFPLTVGEFRTYDVVVINYNLDGSTDTVSYQLKEVVSDSSIIGDETSFRLDRYRRESDLETWVIDSVWSARLNSYQAIVVERYRERAPRLLKYVEKQLGGRNGEEEFTVVAAQCDVMRCAWIRKPSRSRHLPPGAAPSS